MDRSQDICSIMTRYQLTLRGSDAHDSFKHDRHSKDLAKLVRELDGVLRAGCVERRVEVRLAGGVVRQTCCSDNVGNMLMLSCN